MTTDTTLACPRCKNPDRLVGLEKTIDHHDALFTLDGSEYTGNVEMLTWATEGVECEACHWFWHGADWKDQLVPATPPTETKTMLACPQCKQPYSMSAITETFGRTPMKVTAHGEEFDRERAEWFDSEETGVVCRCGWRHDNDVWFDQLVPVEVPV